MRTPPAPIEIRARRAVLRAAGLLRLVCGLHCAAGDAEGDHLRVELARTREHVAILQSRLGRIEPCHRPRYAADRRFQILTFAQRYGLSLAEAARAFVLNVGTVARWASVVGNGTNDGTALVRPVPPVQRFADVVRHVVKLMDQMGFGRNRLIAATLARAGWRLSRETVRRIRQERGVPLPPTPRAPRPLMPRDPNHVWFLDLTTVPSAFRLWSWKLAVVLDGAARFPVAAKLFRSEPTAEALLVLLQRAIATSGTPRVLVTDQGAQFTARVFRRAVGALGIPHRYGAIGRTGSIARIERFWRTLKGILDRRLLRPARFSTYDLAIRQALRWYTAYRPHTALDGATPAERYLGVTPTPFPPRSPPRGRAGEDRGAPPFDLVWLADDQWLPVIRPRAA